MTARSWWLRAAPLAALAVAAACYSTGDGTSPPPKQFYYPVGLAVSRNGGALYVANSDFDLRWNGGTVQAYDLAAIRNDAVKLLTGAGAGLPYANGGPPAAACPDTSNNPPPGNGQGGRLPLGQACAPPMDSTAYWRSSVTIGAFATELQISRYSYVDGAKHRSRLFLPVRGNASLTWIDVDDDSGDPGANPFALDCNVDSSGRCQADHTTGNNPTQFGDSRGVTMPGEPFGMAQSEDGEAIAVTHQTDTKTSLLLSGLHPDGSHNNPSMQFVLTGMPSGGVGLASIPHDPAAIVSPATQPQSELRPAFLQTSNQSTEMDLLRYYTDEGYLYQDAGPLLAPDDAGNVVVSSNYRPFLQKERTFNLTANASGTDSRGVAIDPTPRIACELALPSGTPPTDPRYVACARLPARLFVANRSPASILLGSVGGPDPSGDGTYDPDQLSIYANVPLTTGPSKVFLAPIVDGNGKLALRVFIVCFDSQNLIVYDPDAQRVENIIRTGPGPYMMAFDPFSWTDVATHASPPQDVRNNTGADLKTYRFAYLASFTDSFVQILDLDQSFRDPHVANGQPGATFETIVYTLGVPTQPVGQ